MKLISYNNFSEVNQVIISATTNNSTAVYLRRTTEIEPYNIYDMIDLLPTMFSKFNEVHHNANTNNIMVHFANFK